MSGRADIPVLEPLRGYLRVDDWRTGDLLGRIRVAGSEYVLRGRLDGGEWSLELSLAAREPPEVRHVG